MKARYLIACLTVAIIGCSDKATEGSTAAPTNEGNSAISQPDTELACELTVSCEDGTEIDESVSSESDCAQLESKARGYDQAACQVMLEIKKQVLMKQ